MRERIEIRMLGIFEVVVGGRRVGVADWGRRRPMELVQLLALAPGRSLLREQVIEALWPHLDARAGAANLRKAAHHARQVLGDDAVVLRSGRASLFPTVEVTTDLAAFREAAATALRDGARDACLAAADVAAGTLLPGSLYEEWTVEHRRHVRATLVSLLRTARAWARLVELDPTDEVAHQALMREALEAGARSEVVRRFGILRRALASELGVRPSAGSVALYESAVDGLAGAVSEIIGRDAELAAVEAAWRPARAKPVRALAIGGPAGIGKSTFCRHAVAALETDGRVLRWTDAAHHDQAFGPLIAVMEEVLLDPTEPLASVPPHVRSVVSTLTEVARGEPPIDGPLTRHQVMGAITHVLRATSGGRGTVLVLDDAHDADAGTIDVLLHLASSVPDVIVVLAFRSEGIPDELAAGLARLDRAGQLVRVELAGLHADAAAELVRRTATSPLPDGARTEVVERADGNPFVLIELTRAAESGRRDLPPSVAEAITGRLVGVDGETLRALQRLALARGDLDTDLVVALAGAPEHAAFGLLDRALEAGILVVAGSRYRFRHDLVREALAAQMPPHRRRVVHRGAAARLVELRAPAPVVAHHWLEAGALDEAAPWCIAAARAAMKVGAFRDARRHLAPVIAHDAGHAEGLRLEAECLDMLGDPSVLAAYDAAIAVADATVVDDVVAARALAQVKQGDAAGGLAAIRGATPRSTMGRLNEALTYAGAAALGATDPDVGTTKAAEVRRLALEAGDRAGIVIAAWAHAAAAHARGDLHDSVLNDLRETTDLPHLAVRVFDGHLCMTQRFLYGSRPYDEVITFADELTAEARRLGAARGEAFGITLRAEAMFLSGHLAEAYHDFDHGLRLHRETGGATGEAHALQRLAELQRAHGRPAEARATIDEALDLARVSDIGFHLLDRIYGSRITISDDPDEALAAIEEAEAAVQGPLETCPGCRIHLAVPAAIAAAGAGELERAHAYARAADYLTHVVMRLPAWYAAYDEVQASLVRAEGGHDRARELFASAAAKYGAAGHVLDEARCLAAA
jgi:DNA-binding SARP family transcriptional activator/tetratricopeptide (TPR) repeat protein